MKLGLHWFTLEWWAYLLAPCNRRYMDGPFTRIRTASCRAKGHPAGVWWYTSTGLEPDMRCKNCGDDLG